MVFNRISMRHCDSSVADSTLLTTLLHRYQMSQLPGVTSSSTTMHLIDKIGYKNWQASDTYTSNRRCAYTYIVRPHFSSIGIVLRNVGGVKSPPFLKH